MTENSHDTMSLNTKVGSIIVFTGRGGYPNQNSHAREKLEIGKTYEVIGMEVGGSMSYVSIAEGLFNTVMFENTTHVPDGPIQSENYRGGIRL